MKKKTFIKVIYLFIPVYFLILSESTIPQETKGKDEVGISSGNIINGNQVKKEVSLRKNGLQSRQHSNDTQKVTSGTSASMRTWIGFLFGVVGGTLGIISYLESRKTKAIARRLEVNQLLAEAWDLMGGIPGTQYIYRFTKDEHQLELAKRKIQQALILDPKSGEAHRYLGAYNLGIERFNEAQKEYRKAITLNPSDCRAYTNLATLLILQGEYYDAEEVCKKAVKLDPSDALSQYNLGIAVGLQGKHSEAEDAFKKAIALEPRSGLANYNLAHALMNQEKNEESVEQYRKAIELNPTDRRPYDELAEVLEKMGKYDEADEIKQAGSSLEKKYKSAPKHSDEIWRP